MNRLIIYLIAGFLLINLISSCTIEKRRYRKGYHTNWRNPLDHHKTTKLSKNLHEADPADAAIRDKEEEHAIRDKRETMMASIDEIRISENIEISILSELKRQTPIAVSENPRYSQESGPEKSYIDYVTDWYKKRQSEFVTDRTRPEWDFNLMGYILSFPLIVVFLIILFLWWLILIVYIFLVIRSIFVSSSEKNVRRSKRDRD